MVLRETFLLSSCEPPLFQKLRVTPSSSTYSRAKHPYKTRCSAQIQLLREQVTLQAEQIQKLKDEIAELKGEKGRPNIKPSNLNKDTPEGGSSNQKKRGKPSCKKTSKLEFHNKQVIEPASIPEGSKFKGYKKYAVQDIEIKFSENDIRDYVKKRKISATTRSDAGQKAPDTMLSLKKTCLKLGLSFQRYLYDRISGQNLIPYLPTLIRARAQSP